MSNEFLEKLQAGDQVVIQGPYPSCPSYLHRVTKVTKTQIIIGVGLQAKRFNRNGGREIGGYVHDRRSLRQATPEKIDKLQRVAYVEKIRGVSLNTTATTSTLERICDELGVL